MQAHPVSSTSILQRFSCIRVNADRSKTQMQNFCVFHHVNVDVDQKEYFFSLSSHSNRNRTLPTCTYQTCRCPWMSKSWRPCWSRSDRSSPHAFCGIATGPAEVSGLHGETLSGSFSAFVCWNKTGKLLKAHIYTSHPLHIQNASHICTHLYLTNQHNKASKLSLNCW